MFSRFIKPKWQHKNPAVRKSAVTRLSTDDEEQLAILNRMAIEDVDMDVRCAAISSLNSMLVLKSIAEDDTSERAVEAAQTRLSDVLLAKEKGSPPLADRIAVLKELGNSSLAETIIEEAQDLELQIAAVECTGNQSILGSVALNSRSANLRRAAARRIDDQEMLLELAKNSKHHDKNVYRIAKQKLSTIREQANKSIQSHHHKGHLLASMEALSRCAYSALYAGKYHHLKNQWDIVDDPDSIDLDQRFAVADAICRQTISVHETEELERQQHIEQDRVSHEERVDLCHSIEAILHDLMQSFHADGTDSTSNNALSTTELHKWLESCQVRWKATMAASLPMQQEQKRFDSAVHALAGFISTLQRYETQVEQIDRLVQQTNSLTHKEKPQQPERLRQNQAALERVIKHIAWPEAFSPPAKLSQASKALEHLGSAIVDASDNQSQALKKIETKLLQLSEFIDAGNVKSATGLMGEVRGLMHQLGSRKTASMGNRFSELSNNLNELNDWKSFAATPKKEKLIDKMEHLITSELPPQDRANLIKELQVEWKSLGSGGKNRVESDTLWNRFKLAADSAYEPCKEYFSAQRMQRKENLQQRKIICDELEHFIGSSNWDEIDWKAVEKIVHLSHDEWRKYSSVDRSAAKAVQQRFEQLIGKINEKLKAERQVNAQLKQDLVTQAEVLVESEDLRTAINSAKRLQKEWGLIGITHRSDDRRLWKAFRSACDQIFERRTQQSQARDQERHEQLKLAQALCEKLEQASEVRLSDWDDSAVHIDAMVGEFNGYGPLPGDSRSAVEKRFDDAVVKYNKRSLEYAENKEKEKAQQAWQLSDQCAKIEQELISGETEAIAVEIENLRAALAASSLEETFLSAVSSRVDKVAGSKDSPDELLSQLQDNLHRLRMLCIRLEVLTHADSPEEDKELRMAYQVDRLAEGMTLTSEQSVSVLNQLAGLTLEWLSIGPVAQDAKSELQKRWDGIMENYSILNS